MVFLQIFGGLYAAATSNGVGRNNPKMVVLKADVCENISINHTCREGQVSQNCRDDSDCDSDSDSASDAAVPPAVRAARRNAYTSGSDSGGRMTID